MSRDIAGKLIVQPKSYPFRGVFNQICQVSESDSKLLLHEHSLRIPQEQRLLAIAVDEFEWGFTEAVHVSWW